MRAWNNRNGTARRYDSLLGGRAGIKTIEPLELTDAESERMFEFDSQMRLYNLDAVRRQMQEGTRG